MSDTQEYKLISWNVNGLRAVLKKEPSFTEIFETINADVFALQETKLQEGQVELDLPGYVQTWNYAERKGYSGTAVFSRETPLQVIRQIGCPLLTTRAASVRWSLRNSGLCACTRQTQKTSLRAWTSVLSGISTIVSFWLNSLSKNQ